MDTVRNYLNELSEHNTFNMFHFAFINYTYAAHTHTHTGPGDEKDGGRGGINKMRNET